MSHSQEYVNPISGIYILDPSGIPLFARYYHGKSSNIDSTLLGGFFSAIEVFVKTSLDEMLTDIGMKTSRYFFDRVKSGFIIVLIISTQGRKSVDLEVLSTIDEVQSILRNFFKILEDISSRLMLDITAMIEQIGPTVDNFLFEMSMENLDHEVLDQMEYQLDSGEELDAELLNEIKDKITNK
jgi:hypothetical protein